MSPHPFGGQSCRAGTGQEGEGRGGRGRKVHQVVAYEVVEWGEGVDARGGEALGTRRGSGQRRDRTGLCRCARGLAEQRATATEAADGAGGGRPWRPPSRGGRRGAPPTHGGRPHRPGFVAAGRRGDAAARRHGIEADTSWILRVHRLQQSLTVCPFARPAAAATARRRRAAAREPPLTSPLLPVGDGPRQPPGGALRRAAGRGARLAR